MNYNQFLLEKFGSVGVAKLVDSFIIAFRSWEYDAISVRKPESRSQFWRYEG
jgi:hypothetical protein